jgi:two-component system nitrogen regulation response regulator GlnG
LRVIPIDLPSLRERREDIAELTDYFIGKAIREMGANARNISAEARAKLLTYAWPGNVRELENAVLRASLLAPSNTVQADDIELGRGGVRPVSSSFDAGASLTDLIARRIAEMVESNGKEPRDLYQKLVGELEKPLIEIALERAGGNQVHAARILGLNRNTLRKKLTEHRIVPQKTLPP